MDFHRLKVFLICSKLLKLRHSFATIMKNKGASDAVISEGLGHEDEKTTKIYLEDFENSVLDKAKPEVT